MLLFPFQAPINPSLYGIVNPEIIAKLAGVPVAWQTSDDIALIFLNNSADTATAAASLQAGAQKGRIREVIWGKELIDRGFGDPATDSAVPDIIVAPDVGIIYTASRVNDKVEEHGGLSRDDRLVACFVSNPRLKKRIFNERVYTTQVGPTILTALGISPELLQGAVEEGTEVLPGFTSTPSAA